MSFLSFQNISSQDLEESPSSWKVYPILQIFISFSKTIDFSVMEAIIKLKIIKLYTKKFFKKYIENK